MSPALKALLAAPIAEQQEALVQLSAQLDAYEMAGPLLPNQQQRVDRMLQKLLAGDQSGRSWEAVKQDLLKRFT